MKILSMFVAMGLIVLCGTGCSKKNTTEGPCHTYSDGYGTSISGPDTVASGTSNTDYTIGYSIPTSCGKLLGLKVAHPDSATQKLTTYMEYTGCACADVITSGTTLFGFHHNGLGIYYIQLARPQGSAVVQKKIVVR